MLFYSSKFLSGSLFDMIYLSLFSISRSLCSVECHLFINPGKVIPVLFLIVSPCLLSVSLPFLSPCSVSSCLKFYLSKVYTGPLFNTVFPTLLLYTLLSFSFTVLDRVLFVTFSDKKEQSSSLFKIVLLSLLL